MDTSYPITREIFLLKAISPDNLADVTKCFIFHPIRAKLVKQFFQFTHSPAPVY